MKTSLYERPVARGSSEPLPPGAGRCSENSEECVVEMSDQSQRRGRTETSDVTKVEKIYTFVFVSFRHMIVVKQSLSPQSDIVIRVMLTQSSEN